MAAVIRVAPQTKTAGSSDPAASNSIRRCFAKTSARLLHELGLADLLLDRALEIQRAGREHVGLGLEQVLVEAAIVVDALQRVGRDAQADVAGERVRDEGDVDEVRQKAPLGLDVRVAHLVAHLRALGRQFAAPGHVKILFHPRHGQAASRGRRGGPKSRPFSGTADL